MRSPQSLFSTLNHPSALSRSHSAVLRPAQLRCPSLDTLRGLNVFLAVRGPALSTALRCGPTSAVQRDDPLLLLLAALLLTQARMPWAFLATWAHCWLVFCWLSAHTQSLFLHAACQPLCPCIS